MKRLFCDVDGTLIDQHDNPRPNLPNIFERLSKHFDKIYIWSGGGQDYAQMQMRRLGIGEYVSCCHTKMSFSKFKIQTGDICIDDELEVPKSFMRLGATGYCVPYYTVGMAKNEDALEEVCRKIEAENKKEAV